MSSLPPYLKEIPNGVLLSIKVLPRSSKSALVGTEGDFLKVKLLAPPVEGAANEELIDLLCQVFRVAKKNIKILRGEKSRRKWVEIQGLKLVKAIAAVLSHHKS
jgi:uncharacterized protein